MKCKYNVYKKRLDQCFLVTLLIGFILLVGNPTIAQAGEDVTFSQDHNYGNDKDFNYDSYYFLYPNSKIYDYKKFMKYTYVISDDSVIGLAINKDIYFNSSILEGDEKGQIMFLPPYDIKVYALGPGKATLKVYDGTKLVDSYSFTVISDELFSPSSFVNSMDESYNDKIQEKINKLLREFALAGADEKNVTTNQRVLAALNATIAHGGTVMSEKEYNKIFKKNPEDIFNYDSVYARLISKKAIAEAYATVNRIVLNNLGFDCSPGYINSFSFRVGNSRYSIDFEATTKLKSEYDFTIEEDESIYTSTHLPAWVIGKDTKQQVIDVGQTISLSSSDMNSNTFSSDPSIVTAENGKITGVNPGIAIVYRYNDTHCDMFFVLVNKKGSTKTVQTKIYTKSTKSYFTKNDYAPYILGGKNNLYCQNEVWDNLRLYEMEPIFGHGGSLRTKYSKGKIKCYVDYEGKSELIYTVGSGKYAR